MLKSRPWGLRTGITIAVVLIVALIAACASDQETATPPTVVPSTPIPTIVSTPFRLPDPTSGPKTNLNRAAAEVMVWEHVNICAGQVASESGVAATLDFNSEFSVGNNSWIVGASSPELGLNLGSWAVNDATRGVTPLDSVSEAISAAETVCQQPTAKFADGLTPPRFADPVVENVIAPTERVTEEQARLKVWIAVRGCFPTLPGLSSFTSYSENPERWLVVGTGDGEINYGMWFVDVADGTITPHDLTAITTERNKACFFEP